MSKYKKLYCKVSVIFAVLAMLFVIALSGRQNIYAAAGTTDNPPLDYDNVRDEMDIPTADDIEDPVDQRGRTVVSATSDSTNGTIFSYNNGEGTLSGSIRILLILTILSLLPSILLMLTSFTRIVVVLHFLRAAVGTQSSPPNQVLIGLALFLTLFIMQPVFSDINENAIKPFDAGEITQEQALEIGSEPIRNFMNGQVQTKDIDLFVQISGESYESMKKFRFRY